MAMLLLKRAYDIVKAMDKEPNIHVIPNSSEKSMSFDIGHLKIIDSIQFMACFILREIG